jgi:hypothetical protein
LKRKKLHNGLQIDDESYLYGMNINVDLLVLSMFTWNIKERMSGGGESEENVITWYISNNIFSYATLELFKICVFMQYECDERKYELIWMF